MSSNQSRLDRTDSQQYRNSGGRSNRNYTGGGGSKASGTGSGVGATAAPPSSVNSNNSSTNKPALSFNLSFKKHNNVQGGQQPRGSAASGVALNSNSGTGQRPLQNGADLQQPSHGTSDPPVRNATVNPAATAPPSNVSAANNDSKPPTTPVAPAKAPAVASFSLEFGSISPRYMNGMQVSFLSPGAPVHDKEVVLASLSADVKEKSSQESHVVKSPVPEKKGKKKRKELLKNIDNNAPTSDLYLASSQTSPIENLKGEDESVHHIGTGFATSLSADIKEKSSQESHVVKSPVPEKKGKKKRKDLLKNIDNNAPTSDLYFASSQTSPIENLKGEDESVHHNGAGVATSLSADVKEKSSQESHVVKSPVPEKKGKKKRKDLLKNIDNSAPTSDLYLASSQTSPIQNLKGEDESVHHNGAGVATSLSADESSQESHVVKSHVPEKKGKKKRKELWKNIDNNAPTSDLYLVYKGPEEKKEVATPAEVSDTISSSVDQVVSHAPSHSKASNKNAVQSKVLGPQIVLPRNNADSDRWLRGTSLQKGLMPSPQSPLQMMHKTDNKYEVGKVTDEEQAKQRQLKAILNKLTPQNFEKLFEQVKHVNIDNVVTLTGVILQIFDIVLMEPKFCEMYAIFCYHLSQELPDLSVDNQKITFKRLLLNKCQEKFERGEREQEAANKADVEGTVNQREAEREEKRLKARRRMLGNIRLIGELYKKKMLTERIMHECIKKLLGQYQNPDEEDVEALCTLMSTIGEMIDHPKAKEHMDVYFDMMSKLSNNMKLSSRVRFMLKDSIDLRRNKWQQRKKVEVMLHI